MARMGGFPVFLKFARLFRALSTHKPARWSVLPGLRQGCDIMGTVYRAFRTFSRFLPILLAPWPEGNKRLGAGFVLCHNLPSVWG